MVPLLPETPVSFLTIPLIPWPAPSHLWFRGSTTGDAASVYPPHPHHSFPRPCRMGAFVSSFFLNHVWVTGSYNGNTVGSVPSRELGSSSRWRRERSGWKGWLIRVIRSSPGLACWIAQCLWWESRAVSPFRWSGALQVYSPLALV